jgi:ribosomal protein L7Ae-like RNA K-turn-binding protein
VIVDAATERRLLGLLGLGVRSRGAILGVERVRDAAKRGRLAAAVVAPDASRHSRDKVMPLLAARKVPVVEGPNAAALGAAFGRDTAAVVGIVDPDLARGVTALAGVSEVAGRAPARRGRTGRRTA